MTLASAVTGNSRRDEAGVSMGYWDDGCMTIVWGMMCNHGMVLYTGNVRPHGSLLSLYTLGSDITTHSHPGDHRQTGYFLIISLKVVLCTVCAVSPFESTHGIRLDGPFWGCRLLRAICGLSASFHSS